MKISFSSLFICFLLFFGFTSFAHANLVEFLSISQYESQGTVVQRDDFEQFNNWGQYFPPDNWVSGAITYEDVMVMGMGYNQSPISRYIGNGSWVTSGISANISLTQQFNMLSFDLATDSGFGSSSGSFDVILSTLDSSQNEHTYNYHYDNVPLISQEFVFHGFIATGGEYFTSLRVNPSSFGPIVAVDNVSLGLATNPVPEPATMLLFGTGLVGLAGSRIRKKKK